MLKPDIFVGSLVGVTVLSAMMLSSSTASANDYQKTALIRVESACTLDGTVSNPHQDTITNGTYKSEIGETVLSAVCNDGSGFGVYAIGYTNDTDGNNVMKHATDDTFNIATGTATSGDTSNWAMKVTAVENGADTPTIENGYSSYKAVPSDYDLVASYPAATSENSNVSFNTHYAAYISLLQHSGVYTGKVKYVLVHPASNAPEIASDLWQQLPKTPGTPTIHEPGPQIGDQGKDEDNDGEPDPITFPGNSLYRAFEIAYTNRGKPMYVETTDTTNYPNGWKPMDKNDDLRGKQIRFAMQDIGMTLGGGNESKICDASFATQSSGPVDKALVMDLRDGKSYWITKYADEKCWMSSNLDLELNSQKALVHETSDLGWDQTSFDATASWTPERSMVSMPNYVYDSTNPYAADPGIRYVITSGNTNSDTAVQSLSECEQYASTHSEDECRHYYVGKYYNWTAAVASNDTSGNNSGTMPNSICPAGWRLPIGSKQASENEYAQLVSHYDIIQGDISSYRDYNDYTTEGLTNVRYTPLFLGRNGSAMTGSINGLGSTGFYWTNRITASDTSISIHVASNRLRLMADTFKRTGATIRCVAR